MPYSPPERCTITIFTLQSQFYNQVDMDKMLFIVMLFAALFPLLGVFFFRISKNWLRHSMVIAQWTGFPP